MLKTLITVAGVAGTLGMAAPAFADWYRPAPVPAPVYGTPVQPPVYYGGGYYNGGYYNGGYYGRDYDRWREREEWRRHEAWEHHHRWHHRHGWGW